MKIRTLKLNVNLYFKKISLNIKFVFKVNDEIE